jgi:hypothetical protein
MKPRRKETPASQRAAALAVLEEQCEYGVFVTFGKDGKPQFQFWPMPTRNGEPLCAELQKLIVALAEHPRGTR